MTNSEIKKEIASALPYGKWIKDKRILLESENKNFTEEVPDSSEVLAQQTAFGISAEDVNLIINAMATQGKEPVFSMGEDTPLAFLSERPRVLYDYFKQRFAQVTNPAIDPYREGVVMSLDTYLGPKGNILQPNADDAR